MGQGYLGRFLPPPRTNDVEVSLLCDSHTSSSHASVARKYTLLFSSWPSGNETAANMENVADVTNQPALCVFRDAEHYRDILR